MTLFYLSLYPVVIQSVRQGGEACCLFTVFMYSASSLVKRFENISSYCATISSVVVVVVVVVIVVTRFVTKDKR